MPLKVTRVRVRPSVNVPWYVHKQEDVITRDSAYVDSGLVSPTVITYSEDGLTQTVVKTWVDAATRDAHTTGTLITNFSAPADEYFAANGITETFTFEEV